MSETPEGPEKRWWVYLLRSSTINRSYVGVTVDVEYRLSQHNGEQKGGAKATRAGRPWTLWAKVGPWPDRSCAQRIENFLKGVRGSKRAQRLAELAALWENQPVDDALLCRQRFEHCLQLWAPSRSASVGSATQRAGDSESHS